MKRIDLSEAVVRKVIEENKPSSMTKLAHALGYKGSVSSSLIKKLRVLVGDIDVLLKGSAGDSAESATGGGSDDGGTKATVTPEAASQATDKVKPKAANGNTKPAKAKGRWARDPRNPFREGSAYSTCFDILAAHPDGLPRVKLVELLAKATGKDEQHAAYDAQVLLSARPNENGLNNNDAPRHRSCRPGFWVQRTNGHVKLMVD